MLKNLTYFDTDGRLQLLEVFQTFVDRFPVNLLDNYSELFFFTLFLRLVNDPAQKCRDKVAMVLKKLISKTSLQRDNIIPPINHPGLYGMHNMQTPKNLIQPNKQRMKRQNPCNIYCDLQNMACLAEHNALDQSLAE